jgi:hypothetical protein
MAAVNQGHDPADIFKAIIQNGAQPAKPITNETELALAATGGDPKAAIGILKPGQKPEAPKGITNETELELAAADPNNPQNAAAKAALAARPAKPTTERAPTETELALKAAQGDKTAAAALRILKPNQGGLTPGEGQKRADARTVAQGIKQFVDTGEGLSPSILVGSRLTEQGMALNAELQRMGVDTGKLTREWTATSAAIKSLNGASQVRLAQVINKASASLDKLDELNQQWSDNASRWGIKVLNHASLKAAQNGLYGSEAASVAQRLEGQIADVTSELGQGIMGGNSPTDHALSLASTNLSSDWTQKVLADSIKQVRYNLNLAQSARNEMLSQVGVQGTQFETPAAGASKPPAGRVRVTGPKGETGTIEQGDALPPGWKLTQ